jgi:hypothetical protein
LKGINVQKETKQIIVARLKRMFNKILPSNVLYLLANTMKNKLSDTVRTIPKSNRKILEKGKIDIPK